ncbi:hypothetical protein ACI2JA_03900 [Alkalihalobacillus sp. NPDC078783]
MKLTKKQQEIVNIFKELQEANNNKVFITSRFRNGAKIVRLDSVNANGQINVTVLEDVSQRILNGLDSKGMIQPVDIDFNHLTPTQLADSLYNKEIKFLGGILTA